MLCRENYIGILVSPDRKLLSFSYSVKATWIRFEWARMLTQATVASLGHELAFSRPVSAQLFDPQLTYVSQVLHLWCRFEHESVHDVCCPEVATDRDLQVFFLCHLFYCTSHEIQRNFFPWSPAAILVLRDSL